MVVPFNVDSWDQPAELIMSINKAPANVAAEADAALVECALKTEVSIPACDRADLAISQLLLRIQVYKV